MRHVGTRQLETERLILRRFTIDDAAAMYANWASDDEVTRFLTWPPHANVEVSRAVLQDWVQSYAESSFYQWAIVPKDNTGAPVGSISAVEVNDDIDAVQIGYCIGKSWWRKGITSEALRAVMDFFFESVGANRVGCKHDPNNPHSGMVMQKCGMRYEGTMRGAARNNQGICDVCWYAMLRSDWVTDVAGEKQ